MSLRYVTIQNDMWDSVAFKTLGDERYVDKIMRLNPDYWDIFIFPAGIVLVLPDKKTLPADTLPPWKRAAG